jgi:two-component system, NarL family, response regulator LiaR
VKKTILLYGLLAGVLIATLEFVEYRFLVVDRSLEIYGGLIALLFVALGLWLGSRLARPKERIVERRVPVSVAVAGATPVAGAPAVHDPTAGVAFAPDDARRERLGITRRELEILQGMAAGLSNREIAERLFVSENTVKTHASRVFGKLAARRRTQAVRRAKEAGLIP